jgi:hypothetical protein
MKLESNLNLKIKVNQFGYEILMKMCLRMNDKLDFEVRRKISNLLGLSILNKFNENIEKMEPSIKLAYLSSEKIKEKKNKIKQENHSSKKNKIKIVSEKIDDNYRRALEMLVNITTNELKKLEEGNMEQKQNANILQFKNLNNDETEMKTAAILNLFFLIRKKMNKDFSESIHNKTISIYNSVKEEIENLKKDENGNKDEVNPKKEKNYWSEKSDEKKIDNNFCKDKYKFIHELKNKIKVEEIITPKENSFFPLDESEEIIACNLDKFYNILNNLIIFDHYLHLFHNVKSILHLLILLRLNN